MSDTVPREQIETALQFLECSHGDALRRPWSDEAHAYYHAVDILEAALNEELRPPDEVPLLDWQREHIEQSREAREEGYAAATLLRERYEDEQNKPEPLLRKLKRVFA